MRSGTRIDARFVGRRDELAAIASCAEVASSGRASVIWVEGVAGTGKSTLVRRAVSLLPAGFTVLRAEADDLATDEHLMVASQLGPVHAEGGFAAGMELLESWSARQDAGPMAIVVEDLHWADIASRQAMLTAARRLGDDRVVLIVTTRPDDIGTDGWERFSRDPDRCRRLVLGPLSNDDVAELATQAGFDLARRHVDRLRRHTDGHPLYLHTLLGELTQEQLTAPSGDLPAPRSLAAATVSMLSDLPIESRSLVSAMAVLGHRTSLAIAGRVAGLDSPASALEPLLATGFVRWWPAEPTTPVGFVHPLYRAAVYDDLSPSRRTALHLAAAGEFHWGPSWAHRVAAADAIDDALADELHDGALYEIARHDLPLAAKYLAWAAAITTSVEVAEFRLLEAMRLLLTDGQTSRASELRARAEVVTETPLRDLVLGTLAFARGDAAAGEWFLGRVVAADGVDTSAPGVLAEALSQLALLMSLQSRATDSFALAERGLTVHPDDPITERRLWTALCTSIGMLHGASAGFDRLVTRLPVNPLEAEDADADLLVARGMLGMLAGHYDDAATVLRTVTGLAHRGHSPAQLPRAHLHLAQLLYFTGEWDESLVQARTCQSLVADEIRPWLIAQAEGTICQVLACRGEWEAATAMVEMIVDAARLIATSETTILARIAESTLARARGESARVVSVLMPVTDLNAWSVGALTARVWWPMLVNALLDAGNIDVAAEQLERLEGVADEWDLRLRPQLAGLRARLSSARGDSAAALEGFATALPEFGPDDPVLEHALLRQAYGRELLRTGNRRLARSELRSAHETLAHLGAEPYRLRVAEDLIAAGVQTAGNASHSPLALTDREQDIVALVKKGMTNREVAAAIYVSEKAVEYHLRNVFGKLGISSRRELRDAG